MILTEHLLNAGRRPKTFKRARKSHNCVRQKKKKREREKGIRTGPEPLGGNIKHGKLSAHQEVHSPAWNTCTGWAGAGCWGLGFRGQTKERIGVGCVGTAWGGEAVVTTMREGAWAIIGGHKKRGDCHRSFFLRTLSGSRAPPTHTPGAGVSLCSHLRLQRQTQAAAAAEGPGIGHQLLPPPSWSLCRSHTCASSFKGITASTCWGKRQQAPKPVTVLTPKNIKPTQATHGLSLL